MKQCRDCKRDISEDAYSCPHCGAPYPARPTWEGWGFEYKSTTNILGLPLLHVSFKYRNRRPVVAKGIIAVGQFGIGLVTISQFGLGIVTLCQFTLGCFAVAQVALAYSLIAQFGVYVNFGQGQLVWSLWELLGRL